MTLGVHTSRSFIDCSFFFKRDVLQLQDFYIASKNDTNVAHYNFKHTLTDFGNYFAEMLLSEYAIEW